MVIKYVNGIPFIRVFIEDVRTQLPMNGSWQLTASSTLSILGSGTTLDEIAETLFMTSSSENVTFKRLYDLAGGTPSGGITIKANGLPVCKMTIGNELNTYTTGMITVSPRPTLEDANGNTILTFGMDGPTGIYYPNESAAAAAQYLKVGLVDNNGHVSFAIMYGCYRHASYYPRLQSDALNTFAQGYDEDDLDSLFSNVIWSDDPTPGPEPTPEPKGGFDIMNRVSPTLDIGTVGIYPLPTQKVKDMFTNLWTRGTWETLKENLGILEDSSEMLIGLNYFLDMKDDIIMSSDDCYVTMGNQKMDGGTEGIGPNRVITTVPAQEIAVHDCGTATVPAYFGNYLDYESDYKMFIPFYGYIDLNPSEVVGGTVGLKYNVDLRSGQAIAFVTANNPHNENNIITQVQCTVGVSVPTERKAMADMEARMSQICAGVTGALAGGAIGGPVGAMLGSNLHQMFNTHSKTSGTGIGGGIGYVGGLDPYILVSRPVKATPANMHDVIGYQDCQVAKLSTLSGYVKVDAIKPESIDYTCKYAQDILNIVQNGIYL